MGIVASLVLTACTGSPHPFPLPKPVAEGIYLATGRAAGVPGTVSLVETTQVAVENLNTQQVSRGAVQPDGSFLTQVTWSLADKLQAWVEQEERSGERVDVSVPKGALLFGIPTVTSVSPVAQGQATVLGTADGGVEVIVVNETQGSAGKGSADASGGFLVKVSASAGDDLGVFAIETNSRYPSSIVKAKVPNP